MPRIKITKKPAAHPAATTAIAPPPPTAVEVAALHARMDKIVSNINAALNIDVEPGE